MKIALVYDRINKYGGAERVLEALHDIWPDAPLYTAVYDKKNAVWAEGWDIRPSFLNTIPWVRKRHEWLAWITPFAFESFSFDEYDVVLSITSAEAKGIITKPETIHICYCLTPTRYLWSGSASYKQQNNFGIFDTVGKWIFTRMLPMLKRWDIIAAARPDAYIGISKRVQERIASYYNKKDVPIIYPPVQTEVFSRAKPDTAPLQYIYVSRLVPYKRADLVIDAFNQLGLPLLVIGQGNQRKQLQKMAKKNISFITHHLTDKELVSYYQKCKSFVFASDEDFGIVVGEAQSAGVPAIVYSQSGAAEIIEHGVTGIIFETQTVEAIVNAIKKCETIPWDRTLIAEKAKRFDTKRFQNEIQKFVDKQRERKQKI